MDGTALTGWMYSTTMEDGTPGAPLVAHMLGSPCSLQLTFYIGILLQYLKVLNLVHSKFRSTTVYRPVFGFGRYDVASFVCFIAERRTTLDTAVHILAARVTPRPMFSDAP